MDWFLEGSREAQRSCDGFCEWGGEGCWGSMGAEDNGRLGK